MTLMLSGVLCDSDFLGGWPSAFYVFGILGILWSIAWFILIRDNPADNPWISKQELQYIQDGLPKKEDVNILFC